MTFVLGGDVYDVRQSKASRLSDNIFIYFFFGGGGGGVGVGGADENL